MTLRLTLIAAIIALWAAPAAAQEKGKRVSRVIQLEEMTFEGRIQKPQAFYILPRSNLEYKGVDRGESFLDRVEKSVEKEPF